MQISKFMVGSHISKNVSEEHGSITTITRIKTYSILLQLDLEQILNTQIRITISIIHATPKEENTEHTHHGNDVSSRNIIKG